MALHNELGAWGEQCAAEYLLLKGYVLHEMNWRATPLEIDIIAEWFGEIVFVEVKTRTNEDFIGAKDAVDLKKQENLIQAARLYMGAHNIDAPYRYDVVTIIGSPESYELNHYRNAFNEDTWREDKKYQKETRGF